MSSPIVLYDRRIKHYAGSVTYSVEGFVAKNSDLLERDLSAVRIPFSMIIKIITIDFDYDGERQQQIMIVDQ